MSGVNLPDVLRATAPFDYVRLHGPDQRHLYAGSYPDDDLRGGPTASGSGRRRGARCSTASTTTVMAKRFAT